MLCNTRCTRHTTAGVSSALGVLATGLWRSRNAIAWLAGAYKTALTTAAHTPSGPILRFVLVIARTDHRQLGNVPHNYFKFSR